MRLGQVLALFLFTMQSPKNLLISEEALNALLKYIAENSTYAACAGLIQDVQKHVAQLNQPKEKPKND